MSRRGEQSENPERQSFWKLGGRVWKTVAAVFLSLLLDSLRPAAMPFYAGITAVFCIQKNMPDSVEVAVNREIATILGGFAGMGFLFVELWIGGFPAPVVKYALLAICLVPLISLSVYIGHHKAAFLMCVVFLCVALAHASDVHPFLFAINRILDTTIGIGVALAVNVLPSAVRKWGTHKDMGDDGGSGAGGDD